MILLKGCGQSAGIIEVLRNYYQNVFFAKRT